MIKMSWKQQICQDLKDRDDAIQLPLSSLFVSFTLLHGTLKEAQQRLQMLQENEQIRDFSKILEERDLLNELLQKSRADMANCKIQITELQANIHDLQDVRASNESQIDKLKKYIKKRDEEQRIKNNIITEINDDLLALQTENNILTDSINGLNEKIEALSEENAQLVNRWVEKVKSDADKLNEVNELISKFNKMK